MAIVFEAMPFGPTRRKRQHEVRAIQCLDSALLVDTEYCSIHRRIEVQANDTSCFFFKLRIITGHVAARTVGLESKWPPHSADRRLTDSELLRKPTDGSTHWSSYRLAPSQFQN